jgi:azurin
MFQKIMNRRLLLLTLAGVGGAGLLARALSNRGAADTGAEENPSEVVAPTETALEVGCAENQLAFNPTELAAPANGQIRLTFHNHSTVFMHNWVLVKGGEAAVDQVLQAATIAGPTQNYLPGDMSNVIAHTELIEGGKSATITFATPPAGEYTYLCTFPGHCLAGMRGTLLVTASGIVHKSHTLDAAS